LLGLIQGITEFLPISSSAHLILTSYLLGWEDQGLGFDIALHLGSMLAVVVYLRKDLAALVRGFAGFRAEREKQANLARALLLGTVPVALAGLALAEFVASTGREPALIAATSIGFGVLLLIADRKGARDRSLLTIGWRDGLLIGLGQALALIPGTSRAGITMTVALALGFDRAAAARFSFLLAIPVSALVGCKQLLDAYLGSDLSIDPSLFLIGFFVSGVSAYLAIDFLVSWVKRQDFSLFVAYRVVLGLVILASIWA
jgi:undecaprenyl-diphosphatase